jgi:hypothetical protein
MLGKTAICLLVLCIFLCGCSTTLPEKTGSVKVTSSPSAAEVYFDNEYRGTTPATINAVPAGNYTVEIRQRGYENWSESIGVITAGTVNISASLKPVMTPLPTTVPVTTQTTMKKEVPQIHVDGYWTYPAVRSYSSPIPLFVHAEGANVGSADAREVTSSANLYYNDQQVCWIKIYFGTIKAGGHATKDTMMFCTLPGGADDHDLVIKFENVVVTP